MLNDASENEFGRFGSEPETFFSENYFQLLRVLMRTDICPHRKHPHVKNLQFNLPTPLPGPGLPPTHTPSVQQQLQFCPGRVSSGLHGPGSAQAAAAAASTKEENVKRINLKVFFLNALSQTFPSRGHWLPTELRYLNSFLMK